MTASTITKQAASAEDVERAISTLLGVAVGERELTLEQQAPLSGISAANLRRRWKLDPRWKDVIYTVGESGTDLRTTINRIRRCQDRASIKPG